MVDIAACFGSRYDRRFVKNDVGVYAARGMARSPLKVESDVSQQ